MQREPLLPSPLLPLLLATAVAVLACCCWCLRLGSLKRMLPGLPTYSCCLPSFGQLLPVPGDVPAGTHALLPSAGYQPRPSRDAAPLPSAALFYRLKQHGFKECRAYSDAYAECITGRVLSVAWKCRKEMRELSDCMSKQ